MAGPRMCFNSFDGEPEVGPADDFRLTLVAQGTQADGSSRLGPGAVPLSVRVPPENVCRPTVCGDRAQSVPCPGAVAWPAQSSGSINIFIHQQDIQNIYYYYTKTCPINRKQVTVGITMESTRRRGMWRKDEGRGGSWVGGVSK